MSEAAAAAAGGDSKLRHLVRLLGRTRGEAAIVFTEYRDTLHHLAARLPRALQLHGGMSAAERALVQQQFNDTGGWLLATDAASEGLNLQHRCRLVVNYELPWNPARLEQRIGRVDRIGQRRPVHAITLVARDTAEDLVVANLTRRLTRVAATLGERDRLAAFLDEARIARSVIGAADPAERADRLEAADCAEHADRIDASALAPPDLHEAAARAAIEIQRHLAARPWTRAAVASARATRTLPPGCVIALRCAARTSAGSIVAERDVLVHVPAKSDHARPSNAADVRANAIAAIDRLVSHIEDAVPQLPGWIQDVRRAHAATIDAHIARETVLRDRRTDAAPVQRGLFDRRAVSAAERRSAVDVSLHEAARERIDRLEHDRPLQLSVTPAGVLVLWR